MSTHRALPRLVRHLSSSTPPSASIQTDLRHLLRETAQPVAVVTALMPPPSSSASSSAFSPHARFHGATLSSFSSIALDPHPLIAFSLRIPSRMAAALKHAHRAWPTHMVVNVLAATQADVALRFSRPDLHASPFDSIPYTLSADGLPVLTGVLGALSCKLVAPPWPLHDLAALQEGQRGEDKWEGDGLASELFIARVTKVERVFGQEGRTPLLYHRRKYATTHEVPEGTNP